MTELYQAWLEGQAFQQFMLLFWPGLVVSMLVLCWLSERREKGERERAS